MAKKKKNKKRHVGLHILLGVLLIAFACGAGYYAYQYQQWVGKFLPNTSVNGIDYSEMTADEAKARFRETYVGRVLNIHEMGGDTESIRYDDIDYHFTTSNTFEDMIASQNYWRWPMSYFEETKLTTQEGFAFDDGKLVEQVKSLNCLTNPDIQDPVDAHIEKHEDGYVLVEAIDGNRLDEGRVIDAARKAINEGASDINLEELGCYKTASIYADNETLAAEYATIDKAQNTEITLSMEGNTYVTLDKSTFLPWLSFNNNIVSFDRDAI